MKTFISMLDVNIPIKKILFANPTILKQLFFRYMVLNNHHHHGSSTSSSSLIPTTISGYHHHHSQATSAGGGGGLGTIVYMEDLLLEPEGTNTLEEENQNNHHLVDSLEDNDTRVSRNAQNHPHNEMMVMKGNEINNEKEVHRMEEEENMEKDDDRENASKTSEKCAVAAKMTLKAEESDVDALMDQQKSAS